LISRENLLDKAFENHLKEMRMLIGYRYGVEV